MRVYNWQGSRPSSRSLRGRDKRRPPPPTVRPPPPLPTGHSGTAQQYSTSSIHSCSHPCVVQPSPHPAMSASIRRMEEGRRTHGRPSWRRGGRRENGTMTSSSLPILLFLPMERDFSRERNSGESDSAEGKKTGGRTGVHGVVRAPGARPPATPHR